MEKEIMRCVSEIIQPQAHDLAFHPIQKQKKMDVKNNFCQMTKTNVDISLQSDERPSSRFLTTGLTRVEVKVV